jgi:tyrosyl-tRNA synthetase
MIIEGEAFFNKSRESLEGITKDEFVGLLQPKIEYPSNLDSLRERLNSENKLNVKLGIDPTGPDIHIGHIVPVKVLDLFSRAGHNIDLIFGDFTAKIGDPTERTNRRQIVTDNMILANMTTYQEQVDHYMDTSAPNVRVHRNSLWLGSMLLSEMFVYLQAVNLTEAIQRKDFSDRMERGATVSLAEVVYGTLMGIDSVKLSTDVELGGVDQLLNAQQARMVQKKAGQKAEEILLTPIIEGTAGNGLKMSKSYGNYITAASEPKDMFGKIMSIPDTLILPYVKAYAPVSFGEITQLEDEVRSSPMESKKQLAVFMAATVTGDIENGIAARENFEKKFSRREFDESDSQKVEFTAGDTLINALMRSGSFKSKNELRRIASQGGIRINGAKIDSDRINQDIAEEDLVIVVGKKRLFTLMSQQ